MRLGCYFAILAFIIFLIVFLVGGGRWDAPGGGILGLVVAFFAYHLGEWLSGHCARLWLGTIEERYSGSGIYTKEGWDSGLMVLLCILALIIPLFGWFFGGVGISVGNATGSKKCRSQGFTLVITSTISFILGGVAAAIGLVSLGILANM